MHRTTQTTRTHDQIQSEYVSTVNHDREQLPGPLIHGALVCWRGETLVSLPPTARNLVKVALRNSERLRHLVERYHRRRKKSHRARFRSIYNASI